MKYWALASATGFIVIGALYWRLGMQDSPRQQPDPTKTVEERERVADEALVKKVASAVQMKTVNPGNIERLVGSPAEINTIKQADRDKFYTENLVVDRDEPNTIKRIRDYKDAVYWMRPKGASKPATDPKIIGVVWTEEGKAVLFYGLILLKK